MQRTKPKDSHSIQQTLHLKLSKQGMTIILIFKKLNLTEFGFNRGTPELRIFWIFPAYSVVQNGRSIAIINGSYIEHVDLIMLNCSLFVLPKYS